MFMLRFVVGRSRHLMAMVLVAAAFLTAHASRAADGLSLVAAARAQVGITLVYDARYQSIAYPAGDVPIWSGVCSDVVIRAFRAVDIDLQVVVHRDMKAHFEHYPRNWGLKTTDTNIDHRRVPNLATYFRRQGKAVSISTAGADYLPGDVVVWRLSGGQPHIGIVSDQIGSSGNPKVIHNIGWGTREDDSLFDFDITGHYRWF